MHEAFVSNQKGPPNPVDVTVTETEPGCSSGWSGIHFVDQARLECVLILLLCLVDVGTPDVHDPG